MQIQSINNYKIYSLNKTSPSKQRLDFVTFSGKDTFIRSCGSDILRQFNNFSIDEYLKLKPQELKILRQEYITACSDKLPLYRRYEKIHDITASCMKTFFENQFEDEEYILIPVGRSLSSIGKVLGYKIGEENVKNIPLSNVSRFNLSKNLRDESEQGGLKIFLKYLKSIGLGINDVNNSNKKYVLMDYTITGYSLSGAKRLFDFIFGKDNNKIFTFDITKFLDMLKANNQEVKLIKTYLEQDLFDTKYKPFAFVCYCPCLKNTPNSIRNPHEEPLFANLFKFKLLDNEMQNPENSRIPIILDY